MYYERMASPQSRQLARPLHNSDPLRVKFLLEPIATYLTLQINMLLFLEMTQNFCSCQLLLSTIYVNGWGIMVFSLVIDTMVTWCTGSRLQSWYTV